MARAACEADESAGEGEAGDRAAAGTGRGTGACLAARASSKISDVSKKRKICPRVLLERAVPLPFVASPLGPAAPEL